MATDQYKIEWLLDTDEELSQTEKKQLVENLAEELDADDEIDYGGQFIRKSAETSELVSVGVILVSSLDVLVNLYRILKERDDSTMGVRQVDNEMFYIDEVDPTVIENNGGTVIEDVEGDVFFTLPDDMDDHVQLMEYLRDEDETDDE